MQDGRNMAAILKYLKIARSSLILVRFAPFFRQNFQNLKRNKGRNSDLRNLVSSRNRKRDHMAIRIISHCPSGGILFDGVASTFPCCFIIYIRIVPVLHRLTRYVSQCKVVNNDIDTERLI